MECVFITLFNLKSSFCIKYLFLGSR